MAQTPYQQLEQEFRRLHAFRGAASVLRWDAAVMMPRGSASVRGEQLAALDSECHALLTAPKVSRLIERAQANESQLEDWQLANLREMRRERDHAIATPSSLVTPARARDGRRRGALARGQAGKQFRAVRTAPRGGRRAHARQGPGAVAGAGPVALRRADRRLQPGLPQRRDRAAVPRGVAAPAEPDPRCDRVAGRAAAAADHRQGQHGEAALARHRRDARARLPVRPRPARRERSSVHRGRQRATCA